MRPSPYFGNLLGMVYTSIEDLGVHDYDGKARENNSLLYTAGAGYIDMGHLRESADRTRYLYEICKANLLEENTDFSYTVIEPARYHVRIDYPENWNTLDTDQKYRITREISIDLGQYLAHQSTIWHEIVTWYGYSSIGLASEKSSSFSWEDSYSDLLGTQIAAQVLRKNENAYNDDMAETIRQELQKLDPRPVQTALQATALIQGKWYSGRYPFLKMHKRNFDVGYDDGQIRPFRVPGISPHTPEIPCAVPPLESLDHYGFAVYLQMTPQERERTAILKIVYPNSRETTLIPQKHFPEIIRQIRKEAIQESGSQVDTPSL